MVTEESQSNLDVKSFALENSKTLNFNFTPQMRKNSSIASMSHRMNGSKSKQKILNAVDSVKDTSMDYEPRDLDLGSTEELS